MVKKLVADAISAKGIETATDADFYTLATNIANLKTDIKHQVWVRMTKDATEPVNSDAQLYVDGVQKASCHIGHYAGGPVTSSKVDV